MENSFVKWALGKQLIAANTHKLFCYGWFDNITILSAIQTLVMLAEDVADHWQLIINKPTYI